MNKLIENITIWKIINFLFKRKFGLNKINIKNTSQFKLFIGEYASNKSRTATNIFLFFSCCI